MNPNPEDGEALLQEVLKYPELDPPRLAYAAWCEEQRDAASQARAELIRTQIAINQTSLDILNHGGAQALQSRVRTLWKTYGDTWAAPILPFVEKSGNPGPPNYGFGRGFIHWIKISARRFIDNAAAIFAACPVQHADLTGVPDVCEELFASPALAHLHSLSMDRDELTDAHIRILSNSPHLPHLGWLSVANNHLGLGAAEALAESTNLKKLRFAEFHGNPVDPCDQLGWDSGVAISAWQPPEGEQLEKRYGRLPWLTRENLSSRFNY